MYYYFGNGFGKLKSFAHFPLHSFRILSDMRTLSADWMASTSKADPEQHSLHQETEEMRQNTFYPRPVAPTAAQVSFMFLNFEYAMIYQFKFLAPALPDSLRSNISLWCSYNHLQDCRRLGDNVLAFRTNCIVTLLISVV